MKKSVAPIIAAIFMFYLSRPYFFWGGIWGSRYVRLFVTVLLGIMFLANAKEMRNRKGAAGLYIMLLVSALLFTFFGGYNLFYFLTLLPITFIPFAGNEFNKQVYKVFLNIFVVVIGASVFFYLLSLTGLVSPYRSIEPMNELKDGYYLVYPFFVQYVPSVFSRFSGPFDEPGALGTLCGILLCIQKLNLKDVKSVVLLIAGLLSLSMFFYILIGIYFVIYYFFEKRSTISAIAIVVLLAGGVFLITSNPFLNEVLGERFAFDSDTGRLSGDNRLSSDKQDYYINLLVRSGRLWVGIENKEAFRDDTAGSYGFVTLMIQYGLFAMLWYVAFFLIYGNKYKANRWSFILFVFVFLATIYQRPNVFQTVYVFLFVYLARSSILNQGTEGTVAISNTKSNEINHIRV